MIRTYGCGGGVRCDGNNPVALAGGMAEESGAFVATPAMALAAPPLRGESPVPWVTRRRRSGHGYPSSSSAGGGASMDELRGVETPTSVSIDGDEVVMVMVMVMKQREEKPLRHSPINPLLAFTVLVFGSSHTHTTVQF